MNTELRTESHGPDRFFFGSIDGRPIMFVRHWDNSVCIASSQPALVETAAKVIAELQGLAAWRDNSALYQTPMQILNIPNATWWCPDIRRQPISHGMPNPDSTTQYILDFVNREIAALEQERESIIERLSQARAGANAILTTDSF
jgi:hypothetical protein